MIWPLTDIVVTGSGAVTAAGSGIGPLLELLRTGRDALTPVPADLTGGEGYRWGKAHSFKATDFIPPLKARRLDRCSQFGVAAAGMALKDAAIDPKQMNPERIGIALGCGFGGVPNSAEFLGGYFTGGVEGLAPVLFPNTVSNAPASNASIEHGLKGPNVTLVQRFCSAESAFLMACRFIAEGRADVMLTGGADDLLPLMIQGFRATGQLRRYAPCFGEGSAVLVLESGAHAARRGAVVRGTPLSVATVGMLPAGREREGVERLIPPGDEVSLVSLGGTVRETPLLGDRIAGCPTIDTAGCVGRSLAMGGIAMAALLASLETDRPGLHLASSPEGPHYAIRFRGGASVQS
ncbi:MAG TPA: beta-ketoacyl synthase N-terminal-like domain-containing protein [Desulfuromonadaceae bacterium]